MTGYIIVGVVVLTGLCIRWYWIQPKKVLGSCLSNSQDRKRKMIRDISDQNATLRFP